MCGPKGKMLDLCFLWKEEFLADVTKLDYARIKAITAGFDSRFKIFPFRMPRGRIEKGNYRGYLRSEMRRILKESALLKEHRYCGIYLFVPVPRQMIPLTEEMKEAIKRREIMYLGTKTAKETPYSDSLYGEVASGNNNVFAKCIMGAIYPPDDSAGYPKSGDCHVFVAFAREDLWIEVASAKIDYVWGVANEIVTFRDHLYWKAHPDEWFHKEHLKRLKERKEELHKKRKMR